MRHREEPRSMGLFEHMVSKFHWLKLKIIHPSTGWYPLVLFVGLQAPQLFVNIKK